MKIWPLEGAARSKPHDHTFFFFAIRYQFVTDRQTDGQTHTLHVAKTRYA